MRLITVIEKKVHGMQLRVQILGLLMLVFGDKSSQDKLGAVYSYLQLLSLVDLIHESKNYAGTLR